MGRGWRLGRRWCEVSLGVNIGGRCKATSTGAKVQPTQLDHHSTRYVCVNSNRGIQGHQPYNLKMYLYTNVNPLLLVV